MNRPRAGLTSTTPDGVTRLGRAPRRVTTSPGGWLRPPLRSDNLESERRPQESGCILVGRPRLPGARLVSVLGHETRLVSDRCACGSSVWAGGGPLGGQRLRMADYVAMP